MLFQAYGPAGEDLAEVTPCPRGLLVPDRWAGPALALALAEAEGLLVEGDALVGAAADAVVAMSAEAKEVRS